MHRNYTNELWEIEWHKDGETDYISVMDPEGDRCKEYILHDQYLSEELWLALCQICDYSPYDLIRFKIKKDCPASYQKGVVKICIE